MNNIGVRFQHHPDDVIFINEYQFPLAWWLTQEPGYSGLPKEGIGRLYVPTKRHHVTAVRADESVCQMDGGLDKNFLWDEGDRYIAKLQDYIDAYELHVNPPLTPAQQLEADTIQVKEQAYIDIVTKYPEWKQRNMIAHTLENLVAQFEARGIVIDKTEAQETLDAWDWIKQRRAQADAEEAALLRSK